MLATRSRIIISLIFFSSSKLHLDGKKKKKKKGTSLRPSRPVPPTFKLDTDAGAKRANSQLVQDRAGRQGAQPITVPGMSATYHGCSALAKS